MNTEPGTTLLEIDGLRIAREGHEILRGIDLEVAAGSVHVVLGLNGSGKSTLAYALIGAGGYTTLGGSIRFAGEDITHEPIDERARRGLTLAWQEPARFEGLTVQRYLELGQREPDRARVAAALRAVNLTEAYLPRYVDEGLSGGERKRVELAAVFAMRPRLAILDEPDSGIDRLTLSDIGGLIRTMADEGTSVLLISHRDEVVQIADRASLICGGRIMQSGGPDEICDRYTQFCNPCTEAVVVERESIYE